MTQFCIAAGSVKPATWPTVGPKFMSMYNQPKAKGTGKIAPPTWTRCVSAGHGVTDGVLQGECEQPATVWMCSCSSNTAIPSCPSGNQAGSDPHEKESWRFEVFESRQHSRLVPPANGPPWRNRVAKSVASGSRRSTADQPTYRP